MVLDLLFTLPKAIAVGVKMAGIEMKTHKLRSILSMLGVMLGVASLVSMLTLVGGIDVYLNQKMSSWIGSVWFSKKWDPLPEEQLSWSKSPGLRLSDGKYLKENSPDVKDVPVLISRHGALKIGSESEHVILRGVDSSTLALDMENIVLLRGQMIGKDDFLRGTRQCVISWQIARNIVKALNLKDSSEVIGKSVVFKDTRLTIGGTYGPRDPNFTPWHLRRGVIVPIRTVQMHITGTDPDPDYLQVMVTHPQQVREQAKKIARVLTQRHRGVEDFEYRTAEWLDKVQSMLSNISMLMSVISTLSLLVGGLSIMNVMLSSISERIREIGTRKALGAENGQIFVQFITETTTLSFTGGCAGLLIGTIPLFFKDAILKSTQGAIEPTILPLHLFYTICIIGGLGILFGLYPAIKASRMNPVDALRYE